MSRDVYDTVIGDANANSGGLFFVYGYGGTCKTFIWRIVSFAIRSMGEVVLNVASSSIASLLLPGGQIPHSRFAIPFSLNEDSLCTIMQGSELAELVVKCKLIIRDEAPMMHTHRFEVLDRTMRDLLRLTNPLSSKMTFGGKIIVVGGDFRKILLVIPNDTIQYIIGASISSLYLWSNCVVLKLTKNLCLKQVEDCDGFSDLEDFSKWVASIGDGTIGGPNDEYSEVIVKPENLIHSDNDSIASIVDNTFLGFRNGVIDYSFFENRAILAPTLDIVDCVNEYMSEFNAAE